MPTCQQAKSARWDRKGGDYFKKLVKHRDTPAHEKGQFGLEGSKADAQVCLYSSTKYQSPNELPQ